MLTHSTMEESTKSDETGEVIVKVLPRYLPVEMNRCAALHLYRLLQRYNWCLKDQSRYRERWVAFWPKITPIERKMLGLFILANCEGSFGGRLHAVNPPVDFESFENDNSPVLLQPEVALEYRRILSLHYKRLVRPFEIRQRWLDRRPKEYALVSTLGLLDSIFCESLGLHPDLIANHVIEGFMAAGWDAAVAKIIGNTLGVELEWFFNSKEELLC